MADNETGGGGLDALASRKFGPLPGWAWAGLLGGGAAVVLWLRGRSAKAAGVNDTGPPATDQGVSSGDTAADLAGYGATFGVIQSEIQDLQGAVARTTTTGSTTPTTGTTHPTGSTTPTTTPPKPVTPSPGQHYITVTVGKFTEPNPPWDSTLSGIAAHYHVPGGYAALAKLNGISNPNLIHEGDKIKVPVS